MNERTEARPTRPLASRKRLALVAALGGALALGGAAGLAAAHGGDRMVGRIADRLELDAAQTEALESLVVRVQVTGEALRGDGLRDELGTLLDAPTLDQATAVTMIEARADALRAAAPDLVAAAAAFHDGLNEDQRAELDELRERFGDGRRGWRGR